MVDELEFWHARALTLERLYEVLCAPLARSIAARVDASSADPNLGNAFQTQFKELARVRGTCYRTFGLTLSLSCL